MNVLRALFYIFFFVNSAYLQAESFDFKQAWAQFLKVSDQLQAQQQVIKQAQAKHESGKDLYLPSISLNGSYTHLSDPLELNASSILDPSGLPPALGGIISSIPSLALTEQDIFRSSLQAMWPIYTGGKISAVQSIHSAQIAEKEQELELIKRKLFIQLVDRYYAVSVTEELAKTQLQLLQSLQKHASHAQKLEEQGQIAKVERLNAQVAVENAKIKYNSALRQAEMANIALARMLHERKLATRSILFLQKNIPSLALFTNETMENHPALKLLHAKEDQAQGLIDMEKGAYHPTVFLYGNYTLYEDDSLFSEMEPDWLVGVGIKVPLLSRNGRSGKIKLAKSAQLQARYTRAQTEQDLHLLLEQSYRQLQQAQEEVESLEVSLSLAHENKKLRDIAFRQGLSTSIEKVDAELKLTAVSTQQLAAKYRYIQAYARLMSTSGMINQFLINTF
ncbi:TolC family protein [Psychromonas hadalis]|uniref:TolC family protein n=1 Tax=Psychromonas hadalis TaxID=211669 RepID=UPI0003B5B8EF|nr:TolC family protein [Psychromonas hadalis]